MSYVECETLEDYLSAYAVHLGRKANETLRPLYVPGDDAAINPDQFLRQPFPAQENVINGMLHAWRKSRSLIVCGEMGTGKTLIGQCGIHAHAIATGKVVDRVVTNSIHLVKPVPCYRVLVMCPNHLIAKWKREILNTIPGARVVTFERSDPNRADDSYKEVCKYIRECQDRSSRKPQKRARRDFRREPGRKSWSIPMGPEYVIIGQNQSKHDGGWEPVGKLAGSLKGAGIIRKVTVGWEDVVLPNGRPKYDARGNQVRKRITADVVHCPKCGQPHHGPKDVVMDHAGMWKKDAGQQTCRARYFQELWTPDKKGDGLDRLCPAPAAYSKDPDGHVVVHQGRTYELRTCGEPLWQFTPTPRKYPPATIFKLKARGLFDYFLLDEMHEEQSATSARSIAASKMMTCADRVAGLTGTLIGGYAHQLFPLLMRMSPGSLVAAGFSWSDSMKFARVYGKIETTITTRYDREKKSRTRKRNTNSLRKDDDQDVQESIKPGIMPSFYGHHLIGQSLFVSLSEMEDDLPPLLDDDRSLVPVRMDQELADCYQETATRLAEAVDELLKKGSRKLLGAFLQTLLAYPDMPYDWRGPYEGRAAVGYWEDSKHRTEDNYIDVVTPPNLSPDVVRPKEQALIDLVMAQHARHRKVWVYCQLTDKRDVQTRLAKLLREQGLKVKVLRSTTVDPTRREEWIAENGPKVDVMISHPQLVSTGLDFFDAALTYNFPTIAFYEGDYQVNRVRQAGRRHWRIGQPEPCETYYLYYEQTMQHRQVKLVGDKFAAAKQLEGKFSEEGLAALCGEGSEQMALAKTLDQKIEDVRGNWAKLRTDQKRKILQVARNGTLGRLRGAADDDPEVGRIAGDVGRLLIEHLDLDDLPDFDDPDEAPAAPAKPARKPKKAKAPAAPAPPADREALAQMFEDLAAIGLDLDDLEF